jgi:hypothetical protein
MLTSRQLLIEQKRKWLEKESNAKFYDDDFIFPQKELNIMGGALALLSKDESRPFLLYSPLVQKTFEIEKDALEYEYLNIPYSRSITFKIDDFHYFIDLLFFLSRLNGSPEYLTKIEKEEKSIFEYDFQHKIRKNLHILHCTAGEILFTLLSWRITLQLLKNAETLNAKVKDSLTFSKEKTLSWIYLFDNIDTNFA